MLCLTSGSVEKPYSRSEPPILLRGETLKVADRKLALAQTISLSITFLILFNILPNTQAQTVTNFTPTDKFNIPELNGSISFAVNGSYSEATLTNGTWIFKDLTLNNQSIVEFGLTDLHSVGDLKISTQNSNVTILAYLDFNYSFSVSLLSYAVEGEGKQTANLGLNSSSASDASEWSVIVPSNIFLAYGQGWILLPDGTLVVTYPASNVTIAHFDFLNSFDSNLFFYIQHSVTLITATVLAIVVTAAIIIKVKSRKTKNSTDTICL